MGGCHTELLRSHNAGRCSRTQNLGKDRGPEKNVLAVVRRKRNPRGERRGRSKYLGLVGGASQLRWATWQNRSRLGQGRKCHQSLSYDEQDSPVSLPVSGLFSKEMTNLHSDFLTRF
jgi:hypothetical protein